MNPKRLIEGHDIFFGTFPIIQTLLRKNVAPENYCYIFNIWARKKNKKQNKKQEKLKTIQPVTLTKFLRGPFPKSLKRFALCRTNRLMGRVLSMQKL